MSKENSIQDNSTSEENDFHSEEEDQKDIATSIDCQNLIATKIDDPNHPFVCPKPQELAHSFQNSSMSAENYSNTEGEPSEKCEDGCIINSELNSIKIKGDIKDLLMNLGFSSNSETYIIPNTHESELSTSKDNLSTSIKMEAESDNFLTNMKSSLLGVLQKGKLNSKPSYPCPECTQTFPSQKHLRIHKLIAHIKKKSYPCNICGIVFHVKSVFNEHCSLHAKEKPFQCDDCGEWFATVLEIKQHSYIHHKHKIPNAFNRPNLKTSYNCVFCKRKFRHLNSVTVHMRFYCNKDQKTDPCPLCGKTFANVSQLKTHLRIHTREKPFACLICDKRFTQKGDLKLHDSVVHSNIKPFLCEICGKGFVTNGHFKRHMVTHTQEKSHCCSLCGKAFAYNHSLKKHYMIHTNEKPYQCGTCEKGFTCSEYLKEHIRVHTKEKPFCCKICGKGFSQRGSVKLHQRVHLREINSQQIQELHVEHE